MRTHYPVLLPQAKLDLSQVSKLRRFTGSKSLPSALSQPAVTSWGSAFLPSRTYPNPPPLPSNPAPRTLHHTPNLSGRPHHQNNALCALLQAVCLQNTALPSKLRVNAGVGQTMKPTIRMSRPDWGDSGCCRVRWGLLLGAT